jgi:hypothetical protein
MVYFPTNKSNDIDNLNPFRTKKFEKEKERIKNTSDIEHKKTLLFVSQEIIEQMIFNLKVWTI